MFLLDEFVFSLYPRLKLCRKEKQTHQQSPSIWEEQLILAMWLFQCFSCYFPCVLTAWFWKDAVLSLHDA